MRILIIANGYPSKREPQWGCFERDQALALQKLGHQVSILYVDGRFRTYWRKMGLVHYKDNGLSVYGMFLMPKRWLSNISRKASYRMSVWMMNQVYESYEKAEGKPDVIYAHYLWNIAYGAMLKERYGIPLVGIEHWSGLTQETIPAAQRYRGEIGYAKADKLLAVSESLQDQIRQQFGKESEVVYDMLGPEFMSAEIIKKERTQPFRFVSVGTLNPMKGFDLQIRAFAKFSLTRSDCTLYIIGEGPERLHLEKEIESHHLTGKVLLLGRKTKQEIIEYLSGSQVYVLSSRAETFGVACIEALSQGLPAIATNCGGPEVFINEKNGVLVPSENVEALSNAMADMYNNYSKYDSVAIAEECRRRFAPEAIAGQLTRIFEDVVNGRQ